MLPNWLKCALLLCLAAPNQLPADSTQALLKCTPAVPRAQAPENGSFTLKDLLPTRTESILSMLNLSFEVQDTPDFYATARKAEEPPAQDAQAFIDFNRSPDDHLWKTTLTIKPLEAFYTAAELKSAFSSIEKNRALFAAKDPLEKSDDQLAYFTRHTDFQGITRLLATLTFELAVSKRPRLEGDAQVPGPLFSTDSRTETLSVKWDPYILFDNGADLQSAYSALTSYIKTYKRPDLIQKYALCDNSIDKSCLGKLAGFSGWAAALLPSLEYRVADQFDFINVGGGRYVFSPILQETISTIVINWDLSRALKFGKDRSGALAAIKQFQDLQQPAPTVAAILDLPVVVGQLLYYPLETDGGSNWTVDSDCADGKKGWAFPGVRLHDGLIAGYPTPPLKDCAFRIQVVDPVGRLARLECNLALKN